VKSYKGARKKVRGVASKPTYYLHKLIQGGASEASRKVIMGNDHNLKVTTFQIVAMFSKP
jgi:hypothetical protein